MPAEIVWPGAADMAAAPATTDVAKGAWEGILAALKAASPMDLAFLHDVYVDSLQGETLTLSVPGGGSFIYEQLEDKHRRERMEKAASEVLGQAVRIRLALRGSMDTAYADGSSEAGGEEDGGDVPHGAEARARYDAQNDEGVKRVIDMFKGQVINIEPAH